MGAELNIQRFESKRQMVEAVQLTADADWEAIATIGFLLPWWRIQIVGDSIVILPPEVTS